MAKYTIQSVVCEVNGKTEVLGDMRSLQNILRKLRKGELILINYFDDQGNRREAHGSYASKQGKFYVKADSGPSGYIDWGPKGTMIQMTYEAD